MKMTGLLTVLSTGMVLGAGWADAAGSLQVSDESTAIYGKVVDAITMDVVGGWLRVPGETVVIGRDGFAKDYQLISQRPIPLGLRAAARDGKGKRARSVSRWGTWEGKGRSFDIQGREQSFRLEPSSMPRVFPSK